MKLSKEKLLGQASQLIKNTLMETLCIEFIDFGADYVVAKMPVTSRVHQPDGILHGGATVALAETTGSFAAQIFLDTNNFYVRGIEINANHLKSVSKGYIFAKAKFIHKGRTTQLLDITITDESKSTISVCKLTTITLPKVK